MQTFKILTLTDHRKHSGENSIYALLATMAGHPKCAKVDVASRGNQENDPFFYELMDLPIRVCEVDEYFGFRQDGTQFLGNTRMADPQDYDAVFLRLPRPVSDDFLHFIARLWKGKVIVNHPEGIMQTSSKAFLLNFPDICPPIQLCRSVEEVLSFAGQFPIVLKPLKEYGGEGIVKIEGEKLYVSNTAYDAQKYLNNISEDIEQNAYLGMKFLKNVSQGDKRILVVGGEIMAASLRMPAEGSWLCNVAQGGYAVPAKPEPEEVAIIKAIYPVLEKEGIFIFGADTLVGDDGKRILSEINTLSIGGFPQAEKQTGRPIVWETVDKFLKYVESKQY